jgi:pimeloyl-ACP methyl ester carboxylesterase
LNKLRKDVSYGEPGYDLKDADLEDIVTDLEKFVAEVEAIVTKAEEEAEAKSGWYPEAQRGMSQVGAAMAENMMQTPTGKLSTQWPEPQRFPQFLEKMGRMMSEDYDWSADIAELPMPVLLAFADNDSISQKHVAEFFALLGGGIREPGWLNTQLSKSRLAVVPGYSHYNFITSAEVPQIVGKFLDDPLTNPPTGPAAASQTATPEKKQ